MISGAGETLRLKAHADTGKIPGKFLFCAIIAILFSLYSIVSDAQVQLPPATEVYGKVVDANTKEPIPYANISLTGSIKTTMTDPRGEYYIRTIEHVDSISFSFIGYKTRTIALKRGKTQDLNIELGSEEMKLTEITVKAGRRQKRFVDTVANYVYYQVLANKAKNRSENISSYKYDSYNKMMISLLNPSSKFINFWLFKPFKFAFDNTDTTQDGDVFIPGILKESESTVYYRKSPKATKKIIKADVITGIDDPSIGNMANYQFAEVNPYDNLMVLAGISFITPFSPRGISVYYYYLTDTTQIDGRTAYKLQFVGKMKEDLALKGFAWIDSATWAIRSINLKPNEKANFNFISDYTIKQDYVLVANQDWLLRREELHTVGSVLKKKHETALLVTKTEVRKNFETDITFPDSTFKGGQQQVLLDSARHRSDSYWDSTRFEGLTRQEKEVYHISDTIKLVRAWKTYEFFGRFFTQAFADVGPISIGRLLNFVSKNNVEGWRLRVGFETNLRYQHIGTPANNFLRHFYFTGYGAYGFTDRKFQYMGLMRINLPRKNDLWQSLEAMYRYDMRVPGQSEDQNLLTFDNIVTLISGKILTYIMRVREAKITYEKEWVHGFTTTFWTNYKTYYDIPGIFNFTHTSDGVTTALPNFGITEFVFNVRYCYNDQYIVRGFFRKFSQTKYPVITFRYTAGIANLQGDYFNYHNLMFAVKQRLSSPIGHTLYTLSTGKVFGEAPYTAWYLTQGNLGILLDRFNYNLLNDFEFATDQFVSLWVEHHFEGFFLNKIPYVNKLRLREVVFIKTLLGDYSDKNADVLAPPPTLSSPYPKPYAEAGIGIENIIHLFRVDFLWRVSYRNQAGVPNWGVKFALQPGF